MTTKFMTWPLILLGATTGFADSEAPSVDAAELVRSVIPQEVALGLIPVRDRAKPLRENAPVAIQMALASRWRVVEIDLGALGFPADGAGKVGPTVGRSIRFSPFPGKTYVLRNTRVDELPSGNFIWYFEGIGANGADGFFNIYFWMNEARLQGPITTGDGKYQIHALPNGAYYLVTEVDEDKVTNFQLSDRQVAEETDEVRKAKKALQKESANEHRSLAE